MAVFSILGIVGSAMQKSQPLASASSVPAVPVTITSPLPVPAQQSGTWSVGITGTPNVNIANSPTVNLANSATAPFFSRNVDDPGRTAYVSSLTTPLTAPSCLLGVCGWFVPAPPANHRFVVTHISGLLRLQSSNSSQSATVMVNNPTYFVTAFPVVSVRSGETGNSQFAFDQSVLLYIDAGGTFVGVDSTAIGLAGNPFGLTSITLTGYLLDCSAAPCAAIP